MDTSYQNGLILLVPNEVRKQGYNKTSLCGTSIRARLEPDRLRDGIPHD
jgi:hypothetical protein